MDFSEFGRPDDKRRPEDTARFAAAERRVARLGVVLIVTAVLCGVSNLAVFGAVTTALREQNPPPQPPPNMTPAEREQWERGRDAAPLLDLVCVSVVSAIYIPVLVGGITITCRSGRGWGVAGAIFAMLPCSPGFLLGLPIGIWALVVLSNQDVKTVFEHASRAGNRPRRRRREPPPPPRDRKPWERD